MTQTAKYFYACDYCGLKKEVENSVLRDKDKVERELLKEGWIFLTDFSATMIDNKSCHIGGCMPLTKGEFCSDKCLVKAIEKNIKKRRKGG